MSEANAHTLTRRGERRREAIVEAATRLFLQHGYGDTTVEMVIAEAGGSRKTVYDYFGGKDGLFRTVVDAVVADTQAELQALEFEDRPPHDALTRFARGFLATLLEPRHTALQRTIVAESHRFPQLGALFFQCAVDPAYQRLEAYFRRMQEQGRLVFQDPGLSAGQFLQALGGDANMRALFAQPTPQDPEEIDRRIAVLVDLFLHGCQPRGAAP
jgi:AcrR family transcriptional regulator